MTLNEGTYKILEVLNRTKSDDSDIDEREIKFAIHNQRALWLRNELNKNRTIDPNVIQDLGCVQLEVADTAECCDITTGCSILRTTLEIPNTIELHNETALWVSPVDKLNYPFSFVSYDRAKWVGNGTFSQNNIFAFLNNSRIYIISGNDEHKYMKYINIRGVFENPTEAGRFSDCTGSACYTDTDEYPLNRWMWTYIQMEVIKEMLPKLLQMPSDNSNDAKSNPKPIV